MSLSSMLVSLIVCPDDKESLWYVDSEDFLYNPRLKRKYKIEGDIPILLIDESTIVDDDEDARIRSLPHIVTGGEQI